MTPDEMPGHFLTALKYMEKAEVWARVKQCDAVYPGVKDEFLRRVKNEPSHQSKMGNADAAEKQNAARGIC